LKLQLALQIENQPATDASPPVKKAKEKRFF
jgi:hypothetical protein